MCNCTKMVVQATRSFALTTPSAAPAPAPPPPPSTRAITLRSTPPPPPPPSLPVLDTSIWGPPLWNVLHCTAQYGQSRTRQSLWFTLLNALRTGIPCPDCSAHYNAWLNTHPLRSSLVPGTFFEVNKWILDLHNDVNRRTGKPTWNVSQVAQTYSNRIDSARESARFLQDKIGPGAYSAMLALLNSI